MPDIPGNNTTTASITVGGVVNDVLEVNGDHDWFRITLTAGQKVTITVDGLTLEDSYVKILDLDRSLYLCHLGSASSRPLAEQPGIGPICLDPLSAAQWV